MDIFELLAKNGVNEDVIRVLKEKSLTLDECVQLLNAEMEKPEHTRDVPRMLELWNKEEYYRQRREKISGCGDGRVRELISLYPALQQLPFMHADFKRLLQSTSSVAQNFENLVKTVGQLLDCNEQEPDLEIFMLLQERLMMKSKQKTPPLPPAISVLSSEQADDGDLDSAEYTPPRLVVFVGDTTRDIRSATIIADKLRVDLAGSPPISGVPDGVCLFLVNLLACYYVWDLTYPKTYQLLVFLQQHLLGDTKERLFKATSLLKFEKLFKEAAKRQC